MLVDVPEVSLDLDEIRVQSGDLAGEVTQGGIEIGRVALYLIEASIDLVEIWLHPVEIRLDGAETIDRGCAVRH